MILAAAVQWGFWADGCIRFVQDGYNLPRGPLGVLCYLPFVPVYWLLPQRRRAGYLWISSLALVLVTLGPAYAATMAALAAGTLAIVRIFGPRRQLAAGTFLLAVPYGALIAYPQPPWLPPVAVPVYFYLHWAGIGYLFLRAYHVLADVCAGRLEPPRAGDFLAYLLFAPTLRMGPIYRYGPFVRQMADGPARHRRFAAPAGRLATGALRLAVMTALMNAFPHRVLFETPQELSAGRFLIALQVPVMAVYLWISAYVDWSIAVGGLLGFRVPDNFNYPWRSASIDEFWRRWHITLSAWLKDYLFVPLVRRRWHCFWAFTLTFLFCGLWHGTYPSYVLCGLSMGLALAARQGWSRLWRRQRETRSTLYRTLERLRLVRSPLNAAACWLVTYAWLILCLDLGIDDKHALTRVLWRMLCLAGVGS